MRYMVRATISNYNPMLDSTEDFETRKMIAKRDITRKLMETLRQDGYIKFIESGNLTKDSNRLINTLEIRGYIDVNEID